MKDSIVKLKLNCVFVVEGKTDVNHIKKIFDVETIKTNGSELSNKTLNLIKLASLKNEVILLLDPDYQGKKIQKRILNKIPNCKVCYVNYDDLDLSKNKIGIAETNLVKLQQKILNTIQVQKINKSNLTWEKYLNFNLNTKQKRILVCEQLKIPYFNHKQLYKVLKIIKTDLTKILKKINDKKIL